MQFLELIYLLFFDKSKVFNNHWNEKSVIVFQFPHPTEKFWRHLLNRTSTTKSFLSKLNKPTNISKFKGDSLSLFQTGSLWMMLDGVKNLKYYFKFHVRLSIRNGMERRIIPPAPNSVFSPYDVILCRLPRRGHFTISKKILSKESRQILSRYFEIAVALWHVWVAL